MADNGENVKILYFILNLKNWLNRVREVRTKGPQPFRPGQKLAASSTDVSLILFAAASLTIDDDLNMIIARAAVSIGAARVHV